MESCCLMLTGTTQDNSYLFNPAARRPSLGDAQRPLDPSPLVSLLKGFSCISLFHTSICTELSLSSVLSPEKALFQFFLSFFTTFTSFIFHLYLIHLMFYSHPSRLEFILFAVLSTHFLLHQYFISPFPLSLPVVHFFSSLLSSHVSLPCFCAVADISNHSDPLGSSPEASSPSFSSCVFGFFFHLLGVFCVSLEPLRSESVPRSPRLISSSCLL